LIINDLGERLGPANANQPGTSIVKYLSICFQDESSWHDEKNRIPHVLMLMPCLQYFLTTHEIGLGEIHSLLRFSRHTLKSLKCSIESQSEFLRYISSFPALEDLHLVLSDTVDYGGAAPLIMDNVRNLHFEWKAEDSPAACDFVFACRFRYVVNMRLEWEPVLGDRCTPFAQFLRDREAPLQLLSLRCTGLAYPADLASAISSCTFRLDLDTPLLPNNTILEFLSSEGRVSYLSLNVLLHTIETDGAIVLLDSLATWARPSRAMIIQIRFPGSSFQWKCTSPSEDASHFVGRLIGHTLALQKTNVTLIDEEGISIQGVQVVT
jgi:hypothetical protein